MYYTCIKVGIQIDCVTYKKIDIGYTIICIGMTYILLHLYFFSIIHLINFTQAWAINNNF